MLTTGRESRQPHRREAANLERQNRNGLVPAPSRKMYTARNRAWQITMAAATFEMPFFLMEKFGVSVQQSQLCLFAYLAAFAAGTLLGGFLGDRYGRKYVILFSILGAAPFTLAMPYLGLAGTVAMAVVSGLVIASAFSAILVYAIDLMPGKVGMISGVFFGLMFGLGGIGSAFFGWLADLTSIGVVFQISTWLPLLGIVAVWLPDVRPAKTGSESVKR